MTTDRRLGRVVETTTANDEMRRFAREEADVRIISFGRFVYTERDAFGASAE